MWVEVVDHEDPSALGIRRDGRLDMLDEVLIGASRRDPRSYDSAGRNLEVGCQAESAVADVFELAPLDAPC